MKSSITITNTGAEEITIKHANFAELLFATASATIALQKNETIIINSTGERLYIDIQNDNDQGRYLYNTDGQPADTLDYWEGTEIIIEPGLSFYIKMENA